MVSRKSRTDYQEDSVCFVIRLRLALFLTSGYRVSVSSSGAVRILFFRLENLWKHVCIGQLPRP